MAGVSSSKSLLRAGAPRILGIVGALFLLWLTFGSVDITRIVQILRSAGPGVLVGWVLFGLAYALDIEAWRGLLRLLGQRPPSRVVATAHVSGEAAMMSLPLGVLVAEPMRAYLLQRDGGVPLSAGVAATAARKYLLMASEGVVVGLGAFFGTHVLETISLEVIGAPILQWLAWGICGLLLLIAAGYAMLLRSGGVARRCFLLAARVTPRRFANALERAEASFRETDAALGRFFRLPPRRMVGPFSMYVGVWLLEAFETYAVLRCLGADLSFEAALCIESVLVFARSAIAVFPAGLGVQDLGYALFLGALGVPDALETGAAFALLKRVKEATWVALGYGLLLVGSSSSRTVLARPRATL